MEANERRRHMSRYGGGMKRVQSCMVMGREEEGVEQFLGILAAVDLSLFENLLVEEEEEEIYVVEEEDKIYVVKEENTMTFLGGKTMVKKVTVVIIKLILYINMKYNNLSTRALLVLIRILSFS